MATNPPTAAAIQNTPRTATTYTAHLTRFNAVRYDAAHTRYSTRLHSLRRPTFCHVSTHHLPPHSELPPHRTAATDIRNNAWTPTRSVCHYPPTRGLHHCTAPARTPPPPFCRTPRGHSLYGCPTTAHALGHRATWPYYLTERVRFFLLTRTFALDGCITPATYGLLVLTRSPSPVGHCSRDRLPTAYCGQATNGRLPNLTRQRLLSLPHRPRPRRTTTTTTDLRYRRFPT